MTNSPSHSIEQQLLNELTRAEDPYRRALEIVRDLPDESAPGYEEISDCLVRLQPVMEHINAIEVTLAPLRREWHALELRPGAGLRSTLDLHESLLRELIERINRMEHQLAQARQALAPAVDNHVLRQRMQRAYRA